MFLFSSIPLANTEDDLVFLHSACLELNPLYEATQLKGLPQALSIWVGLRLSDLQGKVTPGFAEKYGDGLAIDYPELSSLHS